MASTIQTWAFSSSKYKTRMTSMLPYEIILSMNQIRIEAYLCTKYTRELLVDLLLSALLWQSMCKIYLALIRMLSALYFYRNYSCLSIHHLRICTTSINTWFKLHYHNILLGCLANQFTDLNFFALSQRKLECYLVNKWYQLHR